MKNSLLPASIPCHRAATHCTVSGTVVELLKLPLVPVMVIVQLPAVVFFAVWMVSVEDPDPTTEVGLKRAGLLCQ